MSVAQIRDLLSSQHIVLFDGGMGTLLQSGGLNPGQSPELFGLLSPEVISQVHRSYIDAGAQVITTNTFGGTRFKLGQASDVIDANRRMASVARSVAGDRACVAGSVGPTGRMVKPLGDVTFEELVQAFCEQIRGLILGGVDFILAETHYDLAEVRAVVVATREESDLPVIASMTFENGVSLTGTPPAVFLYTMQNMGVDGVGVNCSTGPVEMLTVARELIGLAEVPVLVQPNAGLPQLVDGQTVFPLQPKPFAEAMSSFADLGVKALGGCCGTTPEHIRALAKIIETKTWQAPTIQFPGTLVLTSRSLALPVGFRFPTALIGERINPTGKKDLTAELQAGEFRRAQHLADDQVRAGAHALDVNIGAPLVNEAELMPGLVQVLSAKHNLPLSLDSSLPEAIRLGLMEYPGSALVNSISGEIGRMELLGPICRRFGAPFILLPLRGKKLPVLATERLTIIEEMLIEAESLGIPKRLILVDALALAVSTKPEAAQACLEVISYCRKTWALPTVLGLSNISFGLPARELINSSFLSMAMAAGLSACIANPNAWNFHESMAAAEVLLNRDPNAGRFIAQFGTWQTSNKTNVSLGQPIAESRGTDVFDIVVLGDRDRVVEAVKSELDRGASPLSLVNDRLIPAITMVGEKYERREYFLPQLLRSAETIEVGMAYLTPLLALAAKATKGIVVMATVEGDIHDIGKNIVCLMLRNHGFTVVDLGKDISATTIVDAAEESKADVIGLSALMTTTMVKMEEVAKLVRQKGLVTKVMVGGAVLTQAYADRIGADGYAPDAVSAVKLVQKLTENRSAALLVKQVH